MTASGPRWTPETVARSVASVTPQDITSAAFEQADEELSPYLEAAAVLSTYDPAVLRPVRPSKLDRIEAISGLLDHSEALIGDQGEPRWVLSSEVRHEALRRLGSRRAMREALDCNLGAASDPVQQTFEAAIDGSMPPIADKDPEQLARVLQVCTWLDGVLGDVPSPDAVLRALSRASLLEPFRALVGSHFRGRRRALARLRAYVDVLEADSAFEALGRAIRGPARTPMLIHGVGGVGKSTLIARFILDHVGRDGVSGLAFAYIDFDRPGVVVEEPVTVLVEAARQLAIQASLTSSVWEDLRRRWLDELASISHDRRAARQRGGRALVGRARRDAFVHEFARVLDETTEGDGPVLLVLDTFEEVQYRSGDVIKEFGLFLQELEAQIPRLRTVIAGRAPVTEFKTEEFELGELDSEAALGFLLAKGIDDEDTAREIVSGLNGNPLTLQLAAHVVEQDVAELDHIKRLRRRRRGPLFFLSLDAEEVQGYLYRRILDHVHEDKIRRLAHPGLVLRRITRELIAEVLAEPCGVVVPDAATADRLFEGLRREVTLVTATGNDVLEHRTDVRRVMLPLLENDEPEVVEQIHRAAVTYYGERTGAVERAEEIYHRLFVDDLRDEAEERWTDGVEEYLAGALEELPAEGQVFLSPRVHREPADPTVWLRADERTRERRLERRVEDLLGIGRPDEALEVLAEAMERSPASRLHVLEPIAYRDLGRFDNARQAIDAGLAAASTPGTARLILELLELAADVELEAGYVAAARERLVAAYRSAKRLRDPARALALGARWLEHSDREPTGAPVPDDMLDELFEALRAAPEAVLKANPALTRSLAVDLGDSHPAALMRALRTVGLPGVDEADLQRSGAALKVAARLRERTRRRSARA